MIQNVVISLMHIKDYKRINELFIELHQVQISPDRCEYFA